ncbi:MAG: hypothetical protein H6Q62_66, partial [Firmicutes bacterium]|nr:hypothetical protein [Bacillota bacterium]
MGIQAASFMSDFRFMGESFRFMGEISV